MELSPDQAEAKTAMLAWFSGWYDGSHDQQIFRIFGFAGVGKTTIIEETTKNLMLPSDKPAFIVYGAYTGKAALVMQRAGVPARTIHSLIYVPIFPDQELVTKLKADIVKARKTKGNELLTKSLTAQLREASSLSFEVNDSSVLMKADLAILDECSMVNAEMLHDLLGFGKPLLVLGDPGQLPPVKGTGALIDRKPDILLTQIHRQALENPIINLSMRAREGLSIPLGQYGSSSHVAFRKVSTSDFKEFDQILVGKNKTRRAINTRMREILGYTNSGSLYPVVGDKLICLRNNRKRGLLNGLLCRVTDVIDEYDTTLEVLIITEDGNEISVRISKAYFDEYDAPGTLDEMSWLDFRNCDEFDYGYAITVHKAQGSQWNRVGFYDDRMLSWNKLQRRRWLYTGITRAIDSITIMT